MSVILRANHWLLSSPCSFVLQFLFQQMGMVVCFVKIHIRPYMDDIFTLIRVSNLTVSTHPHKAPKHRSLTHFYFPVSQKNGSEPLDCSQLCWSFSSLGVMLSGPLDKVFPRFTQQYTLRVAWYLKRLKRLWYWENEKIVIRMWIWFFFSLFSETLSHSSIILIYFSNHIWFFARKLVRNPDIHPYHVIWNNC